jgi:uncharacterized membrane protein YccC
MHNRKSARLASGVFADPSKIKGMIMNKILIFLIRAVVGIAIAFILLRMFYPQSDKIYVPLLAAFLVGIAYLAEYLRRGKKKQ